MIWIPVTKILTAQFLHALNGPQPKQGKGNRPSSDVIATTAEDGNVQS
jgi:hypothetical protein